MWKVEQILENASNRGGCWFCPNSKISQYADIKEKHLDLWNELKILSQTKNLASNGFKYGKTFEEVDKEIDNYIFNKKMLISLFDKED